MSEVTGGRQDGASVRIAGIDVLRGLCVLLVVLHHINLRFWLNHFPVDGALPSPLGQVLFWSGYYAVVAFFVIGAHMDVSDPAGFEPLARRFDSRRCAPGARRRI